MNLPAYGTPGGPVEPNGEWSVEQKLRQQAVINLRRRAAFRIHFLVYALVNVFLVVIWGSSAVVSGVWFPWFLFPVFGWGIGLGVHAWTTYRGDELSEDRIRAEMNRIIGG
jgi:2TM domain